MGDNPNDPYEKTYGNSDLKGGDAKHGTHVAGLIGANRKNNVGIKGIADNVEIIAIRVVPTTGDERDKDIANGIIYAVDNGAQIINMSFGKDYSPYKDAIDKAVKYAEQKGVLMMHAAGNESEIWTTLLSSPRDTIRIKKWHRTGWKLELHHGEKIRRWLRHFPTTEKRALTYLRPALKSIQQRRITSMKICREPASLVRLPAGSGPGLVLLSRPYHGPGKKYYKPIVTKI